MPYEYKAVELVDAEEGLYFDEQNNQWCELDDLSVEGWELQSVISEGDGFFGFLSRGQKSKAAHFEYMMVEVDYSQGGVYSYNGVDWRPLDELGERNWQIISVVPIQQRLYGWFKKKHTKLSRMGGVGYGY